MREQARLLAVRFVWQLPAVVCGAWNPLGVRTRGEDHPVSMGSMAAAVADAAMVDVVGVYAAQGVQTTC